MSIRNFDPMLLLGPIKQLLTFNSDVYARSNKDLGSITLTRTRRSEKHTITSHDIRLQYQLLLYRHGSRICVHLKICATTSEKTAMRS
jgi:hypothetical protein